MGRLCLPMIVIRVFMIEAILRTMLGTAGYRLMELYVEYSLPINALIFAFLGLILLGRKSFRAIKESLKEEIERVSNKSPLGRPEAWFAKVLDNAQIDWNKIGESTKIPFFSSENYYWFSLKNAGSIRKHCSPKRVASWFAKKKDANTQKNDQAPTSVKSKDD